MIKTFYALFKKSGLDLRNWSCIGICLVFVLPVRSLAQNPAPPLDQYHQAWYSKDKKVTYTQRMEAGYGLLVWHQNYNRQDSLLSIAQQMVIHAKQKKDPAWTAEGLYWIAVYHLIQGDIERSIRITQEALKLPGINDCKYTHWYYGNLGHTYVALNQLDSAEYYYKKGLAIGQKHGLSAEKLCFLYLNLADIYQTQGKYLDAIDLCSTMLHTANLKYQFIFHQKLGSIFTTLGLQAEAKANYQQADVLARKINGKHIKIASYVAQLEFSENLVEAEQLIQKSLALGDDYFDSNQEIKTLFLTAGNLYLDSLKLDQATDYYQRALALSIKVKEISWQNEALLPLAKVHQLQGRTQKSMQICLEIKPALEKNRNPGSLAQLYAVLSKNYEALQQPTQALFYLRQKEAQEAIINDNENIKAALSAYISRKSEQERAALKLAKNNAEKLAVAVQAKSRLNYGIFGLLILFLSGVVVVYYTFYRQKKSVAEQLAQVNQLLESEKQKLTLSNTKLQRFSGIVSHDILSNLDLILSTGNVLVGSRPNPENLNKYYTLTQNTGRQLKEYCLGLLAEAKASQGPALAEIGDPTAVLNKVLERFEPALREKGFAVEVGELPSSRLPLSVVEQVLQNLVSNALRYASQAPNPRLQIGSGIDAQGNLCWFVADNGPGEATEINRVIQGEQATSAKGQGVGLNLLQATLQDYGWGLQAEAVDRGGLRMVVKSRG